jgi:diguanylate cyclase (GGDEF)-like protein
MSEERKQTEKFSSLTLPRASEAAPLTARSARTSAVDSDWLTEDTQTSRSTEVSIDLPSQLHEAGQPHRALLTVVNGFNAGQVFRLEQRETIIGRGRDVHVRMDDAGVSRQHTLVARSHDGRFFVEDMESTNGTFVAGERILARTELQPGDQIQVGPNVLLTFLVIDESAEALARQLYESSTRDALTGAFNRKYLMERLSAEVTYAARHKAYLTVVLFDLDHFKLVNDTYGHLAGDTVLKSVALEVNRKIRTEDVLTRYGGEEFVVLVRSIEHNNVALFAERLRRAVERLVIPVDGFEVRATISIGVASLHECQGEVSVDALLLLADERLYRAKSLGRNRVVS